METACLTRSYEAEAIQIVVDVFSSMLRMEVIALGDVGPATAPLVTGTVHFVGSWKGALRIECSPDQTFEFTKRLLGVELPTVVNEDVCDAFGELANMIGGNLKAVLPPTVHLSMPSVVKGIDYSVRICQTSQACQIAFHCEFGTFWVTLVEFVA